MFNARCGASRQHGTTTVEMAIVSLVLFVLFFGVMDVSRLFFTHITLQHAMREGGRFAVTGNTLADPENPGQQQTRLESIRQVIKNAANGVDLDVQDIQISSRRGDQVSQGSAGAGGETVTLELEYDLRLSTPIIAQLFEDGRYNFTVRTTFRNEPFGPGAG